MRHLSFPVVQKLNLYITDILIDEKKKPQHSLKQPKYLQQWVNVDVIFPVNKIVCWFSFSKSQDKLHRAVLHKTITSVIHSSNSCWHGKMIVKQSYELIHLFKKFFKKKKQMQEYCILYLKKKDTRIWNALALFVFYSTFSYFI